MIFPCKCWAQRAYAGSGAHVGGCNTGAGPVLPRQLGDRCKMRRESDRGEDRSDSSKRACRGKVVGEAVGRRAEGAGPAVAAREARRPGSMSIGRKASDAATPSRTVTIGSSAELTFAKQARGGSEAAGRRGGAARTRRPERRVERRARRTSWQSPRRLRRLAQAPPYREPPTIMSTLRRGLAPLLTREIDTIRAQGARRPDRRARGRRQARRGAGSSKTFALFA